MKKICKKLLSLILAMTLLLPAVNLPVQATEAGKPAVSQDSLEEAYLKQYLEQIDYQLNLTGQTESDAPQGPPVQGDILQVKSIGGIALSSSTAKLTVEGYNKVLPSVEIGQYDEHFGNGLPKKMVPLTLSRPEGASAQYPVSIGLRAMSGSLDVHRMWICDRDYNLVAGPENTEQPTEEKALRQIVIPAGQTETTVYLYLQTGSDAGNFQGTGSFYLQFYNGHRTEVETPFVQVCLRKDALPEGTEPEALESTHYGFAIPEGTADQGVILGMPVPIIASPNSTLQLASATGSSLTLGEAVLSPAESGAEASNRLTFLYFPTEEDLDQDGWLDLNGKINALSLGDYSQNSQSVTMTGGAGLPVYKLRYAKPEYGRVSVDKGTYKQNETVNVTVPIQNASLLEKAKQYPVDELRSWFALSLDGGANLLSLSDLSYSENAIHASFTAPATAGSHCVEVIEMEEERGQQGVSYIATAPYGVFKTFQVGSELADFVPVESLTLESLPQNNRISLENLNDTFTLSASVTPESATFKGASWTSSDPEVATITSNGILTGLKTGVTTITAKVEGEINYREANGLEPSDALTKSVVIYVGAVNPRVYDGSATCYNTEDGATLPLNDNFDKVVPPGEEDKVYATLRYDFEIFDVTEEKNESLYKQENSAIGGSNQDLPAYLTGNSGRSLVLRFGEGEKHLKKLSSAYKAVAGRMQLLPAYRVELSAQFTHQYFEGMNPTTATYYLYVMPNGIITAGLPIEQGAIYPVGVNLGKPFASFQNVPENFTKAGYVLTRRYLQQEEYAVAHLDTTKAANNATFQFTNKGGRYDLKITPQVDYSSLQEGNYTYTFYIEDEYLGRYERTTTFSIKPLAGVTKAYVDNQISGQYQVTELTKDYQGMTENPTNTGLQGNFFKSFYRYKPVNTLRVEAPANYGDVMINGKAYSGSEFLVQFPGKSGASKLEIKWTLSSQPINLEYPYVLDQYAIVELPQSFHTEALNVYHYPGGVETPLYFSEALSKPGYLNIKPYEGKLIVRLADITLPLKIEHKESGGEGKTYSAMLAELAPATYIGAPEELTISPKSSAKQESLQASGGFVTNYALMRENTSLNLAFSFDTQFSSLQIVTIDEKGETQRFESVAQGSMSSSKVVDYTSIIENPGWKLVVECTRYTKNSEGAEELAPVLEIFDYNRLKELSGGFAQKLTTVPVYSAPASWELDSNSQSVKPAALYISDVNTSYFDLRNRESYNVDARNQAVITAVLPDSDFPGANPKEITLEGVTPNETETLSNEKLKHQYHTLRYSAAKVCSESGYANASGLGRTYSSLHFAASGNEKTCPANLNTHNYETVSLQWQLEDAVPRMESVELEDLGDSTTGEASGLFDSMTIPLPKTPFSFQIEKKGNEYIISGVLQVNLLPDGGFSSALSELSLAGEEAFNKIYNECRKNVLDATEENPKKTSGFNVRVGGSAFAGFIGYISARGYLNPDTGKVAVEFQEGGLIGEISAEMRQFMSLAFGEFGFKFEFSTSSRMIISMPSAEELKLASNPDGMKINLELGTENKVSLDARIGVGISLFFIKLTAGVGGEFSLGAETTHIRRPYIGEPRPSPGGTTVDYRSSDGSKFTGSSRLYFYTSIGILFVDFTTKYTLVEGSFDVLSPNLSTNPYHKDYPFKKEQSNLRFLPQARLMAISGDKVQGGTKIADGLLQSSGAGYYGDGKPVYVKPDEDYNQYSLHADATTLGTAGKGKFGFDSAANSSGKTLLAWEQIDDTIQVDAGDDPNAALLDYMGKTEVYASVWDGNSWGTPSKLSENNLMDMTPRTAVNESGDGVVVWNRGTAEQTEKGRKAEEASAPDLAATSELVYARYDQAESWGDMGKTVVQLPANTQIVDYSVAMSDTGNVLIAAALQKAEGLCDIEYYYIDASESDSVSIYQDANRGLSPQVIWDAEGFHVAYYSEQEIEGQEKQGTIYYGGFDPKTSAVTAPVAIDGPLSQNLKIVPAENGPVLVWSAMTAGMDGQGGTTAQNGLYASKLISRTEKLTDAEEETTRVSVIATQPQLLGGAPYAIPSFDAWTEGNKIYANVLLADLETGQPGAALYKFETEFINEIDVSADFNYDLLQPGVELPITFTVRNQGFRPIEDIAIQGTGLVFEKAQGLELQPGASMDFTVYLTLPEDKIADLNATVQADFTGGNTVTKNGVVYLKAADLSVKLLAGEEDALTLSALNRSGFELSENTSVTLGLYRDANGMIPIGQPAKLTSQEIQALNAGGSVEKTFGDLPEEENTAVFAVVAAEAEEGGFLWELNPSDNVESTVLHPVYKEKTVPQPGGDSNPRLDISTAQFDRNPAGSGHQPISAVLTDMGSQTLSRILYDGRVLKKGTDYSLAGNVATLQKSFLKGLPLGEQELVFELSNGARLTLKVVVTDTRENPFTDVSKNDWFYDEVCNAYKNGLIYGTSDTEFSPRVPMTRAMLVTILHRLEGKPDFEKDSGFTDVVKTSWYARAVAWAVEQEIVNGYGGGLFGPNDPVTREQLAAILYRYAQSKGYDVSEKNDLSIYTDAGNISAYAREPMEWANAIGLIQGRTATELAPKGLATRAEAATILTRFIGKFQRT